MSLTPEDIEQQVFKERFRGYDQDEVDRFLDRVSEGIAELTRERDELRRKRDEVARERDKMAERLSDQERTGGEKSDSELIQRTLLAAQRAADETIADARADAEQTVQDAREQAEEIVAQAHQRLEEDARRVAENERRALEVLAEVREAVEDFARFRLEYREQIEAVIVEQLAAFDRIGDLPDLPQGLRSLAERSDPAAAQLQLEEIGRVSWEHDREK